MNRFLLWIAQGFGIGRIPVAPGTFGSLEGLAWFALLLLTGNVWLFLSGTIAGFVLSVWLCSVGEETLGKKDPGSVVFDEIAAIPLCYLGWIILLGWKTGSFPSPQYFFSKTTWPLTAAVFVAFRLFDILKPWPVRQSQALTAGLGITIDDALAAVYVNLIVLSVYGGKVFLA